ncbi:MAG: His/Gly/Thr/Pro-type tRNA ligase C-terminal domain-containing protein, partial [Lactobacillus iners]|nr:His/Gly/Thr/Pro-type tRNA ligase C-terminal domain-containing protein [Lactobacillus iners]
TVVSKKLEEIFSDKYDVLYDDRNERPGVKFNDADLIGAPIRIIVGRRVGEQIVEVKKSTEQESVEMSLDSLTEYISKELR